MEPQTHLVIRPTRPTPSSSTVKTMHLTDHLPHPSTDERKLVIYGHITKADMVGRSTI
jgi:hypothetical protein